MRRGFVVSAFALLLLAAAPDESVRSERVRVSSGGPTVAVAGRIKGWESVTYRIAARRGDRLTVRLKSTSLSNYFNITAPGADSALFIGSTEGDRFSGILPASGDYAIAVYLMRNAARRGTVSTYTLSVGLTGDSAVGGDVLVPGTPYHATAQIACGPATARRPSLCSAGVVRRGSGSATVHITLPGGGEQILVFRDGRPILATPDRIRAIARANDKTAITLESGWRFDIVDAFINGG